MFLTFPIDSPQSSRSQRAQVRLQTRTANGPKGMFATFTHILRNDGFRGLYNGVRSLFPKSLKINHPLIKNSSPPLFSAN